MEREFNSKFKDEPNPNSIHYGDKTEHPTIIDKFEGEYFFLSNFYMCPITFDGVPYTNSEAAFHAQKCPKRKVEFSKLNSKEAKRLGRSVDLLPDWDDIRVAVMFNVCLVKFFQNPDLAKKLVETEDAELIEGNTWGDKFWGVCDGVGKNNLGKILMEIRSHFKTGRVKSNPLALLKDY